VLPDAAKLATRLKEPAWSFAARSGEEYELLAAVPADEVDAVVAGCPVPATVIGAVEAEPGLRATERGVAVRLADGYDHFGAA
jgi:thiamine monophosphate kinase